MNLLYKWDTVQSSNERSWDAQGISFDELYRSAFCDCTDNYHACAMDMLLLPLAS